MAKAIVVRRIRDDTSVEVGERATAADGTGHRAPAASATRGAERT
ncbi:MAG: hypothetical protein ACLGIO_07965 [Acidimicrobiia bacterium]